jgi:septal ring factor EnvC (AmiA/AmiB activator)
VADEDYERGKKEGRVDALLEEHTARLNKINGSVERHAKSVETLAKQVNLGFEKLASEIRTMQEEARIREAKVSTAAETLAVETERRRKQLADDLATPVRTWGIRGSKASVTGAFVTAASFVTAIYFAFH